MVNHHQTTIWENMFWKQSKRPTLNFQVAIIMDLQLIVYGLSSFLMFGFQAFSCRKSKMFEGLKGGLGRQSSWIRLWIRYSSNQNGPQMIRIQSTKINGYTNGVHQKHQPLHGKIGTLKIDRSGIVRW